MWPIERSQNLIRVGRAAVERWEVSRGVAVRKAQGPLEGLAARDVGQAVRAAVEGVQGWVDAVIESTWMPVVPLPGAGRLMSHKQAESLLLHRLRLLYGDGEEAVDQWTLRVDYRPGEALSVGYALAPSIRDALANAFSPNGVRCRSWQPAWAWSLRSFKVRQGWWAWCEQDRALLGYFIKGRCVALNCGLPSNVARWDDVAAIEALRWGLEDASVRVGYWSGIGREQQAIEASAESPHPVGAGAAS